MIDFTLFARAVIGTVLIVASASKLTSIDSFATSLSVLGFPSVFCSRTAAGLLAAAEGALGLVSLLMISTMTDWLIAALMIVFVAVSVRSLVTTAISTCNCFGSLAHSGNKKLALTRAALLALLAVFVISRHTSVHDALLTVQAGERSLVALLAAAVAFTAAQASVALDAAPEKGE